MYILFCVVCTPMQAPEALVMFRSAVLCLPCYMLCLPCFVLCLQAPEALVMLDCSFISHAPHRVPRHIPIPKYFSYVTSVDALCLNLENITTVMLEGDSVTAGVSSDRSVESNTNESFDTDACFETNVPS